jgi:hypothetical protein
MDAAAAHAALDVSCAQCASGATITSTLAALAGCAPGHSCRPSGAGTERAPFEAQDMDEASGGKTEPGGHALQKPEQAAEDRPAAPP